MQVLPAISILCFLQLGCGDPQQAEEEAIRVIVTPVRQESVTIFGDYVGQTRASKRVEINPRIDGFLEEIAFIEGSAVKEGATLFRIDDRDYQANVERLQATLESKRAILAKYRRDVARIEPLFKEDAASQLDYDVALSNVEQGQAMVRESLADLKRAELELEFTEIVAPISGLAGEASVDVGALVRSGTSVPLTTVSQIDPIHVYFSMSALDYLNARRRLRSIYEEEKAEREGKALEGLVSITLPDDSEYGQKGMVGFTDPQVNPQTGTFAIRAIVPNPSKELLPGQYTRVRMPLEVRRNALLIPEESIVIEQGGVYVYVVLPNQRAERRLIFQGPIIEGQMIVEKGLSAEEMIIVEGINKIQHGSLVVAISPQQHAEEVEAEKQGRLEAEPPGDED